MNSYYQGYYSLHILKSLAPYQLRTELLSDFPHHVVCNRVQPEKHDMEIMDMMDIFTPIPTTAW
jgi:hypothetical protein